MWQKWLLAASILMCSSAQAELRHYVASLDNSMWKISEDSPVECQLSHDIPGYGTAMFTSRSGKDMNMLFTLDMWLKPDAVTQAKLISRAPQWRPGLNSREITTLTYHEQFNGEVPKKAAWAMLNELSQGMVPTFYYADWYNPSSKVAVGISSANFSSEYHKFRACLANLLPYGFDDISFTVLNYREGGKELTRYSKKQLERVKRYLEHDQDVDLILVDAYTDSYGEQAANQQESELRAQSVKDILVASGIDQTRISTTGHGERRHVAGNALATDRQINRRVVIKITKDI
ncbi:OmpA family protein [Shewanella sp. WXL01]|uniref:OmpA family protein n=1 Tax=Shewanella maritima TaxID=2520507 RepID=A0A411PLK5_9GAMM|nr:MULTISPECIES: OmpA family protein [Shewanella]NKF52451.1 OmpA family protein [Shewanella sp. WXL01]QBF84364.1 OmpA family protein [Shewanella maritima]